MRAAAHPRRIVAGVVGLGLMGCSIASCLLAAGHRVIGLEPVPRRRRQARGRVRHDLDELARERLLRAATSRALGRLRVTSDYADLAGCGIVIEATVEDLATKRAVIASLERVLARDAIIGLNTSALPITRLQRGARHPGRVLGVHWAEPAYLTRFMEVILGDGSDPTCAERVMALAARWGKEPTLVRRDVPGFITNRLMYALIREGFHLVESGVTDIEGVDRSMRNDLGSWITFAGPFRFMDLTGIPAYRAVMRGLLPDLDRSTRVPRLMERVADSGALGTANARGFYRYTKTEARRWDERFARFSTDIRRLSLRYAGTRGKP
jgi:3-hydroxybutyryl-CoA dehydrogenase